MEVPLVERSGRTGVMALETVGAVAGGGMGGG